MTTTTEFRLTYRRRLMLSFRPILADLIARCVKRGVSEAETIQAVQESLREGLADALPAMCAQNPRWAKAVPTIAAQVVDELMQEFGFGANCRESKLAGGP